MITKAILWAYIHQRTIGPILSGSIIILWVLAAELQNVTLFLLGLLGGFILGIILLGGTYLAKKEYGEDTK